MNFDHRESLDMYGGAALLEAADKLQIMIERQIRMEAADNVKFRGSFPNALFRALVDFFERERVRSWRVGIATEGAEFAVRHADVRRIDVPIDVEIGDVAVALLADVVRQPAHRKKIRRTIEGDAVVHIQAFAREDFCRDGLQPLVCDGQFAHFESAETFTRAKTLPQRPRTTGTID